MSVIDTNIRYASDDRIIGSKFVILLKWCINNKTINTKELFVEKYRLLFNMCKFSNKCDEMREIRPDKLPSGISIEWLMEKTDKWCKNLLTSLKNEVLFENTDTISKYALKYFFKHEDKGRSRGDLGKFSQEDMDISIKFITTNKNVVYQFIMSISSIVLLSNGNIGFLKPNDILTLGALISGTAVSTYKNKLADEQMIEDEKKFEQRQIGGEPEYVNVQKSKNGNYCLDKCIFRPHPTPSNGWFGNKCACEVSGWMGKYVEECEEKIKCD